MSSRSRDVPPAPDDGLAGVDALVLAMDTGDRIHYLDWGDPNAPATEDAAESRAEGSTAEGSRPSTRRPLVMLVHGLAQTAWVWAPIARRIQGRAHVLTPDLRGHGSSETPVSGYDLESLAFDLLTIIAVHRPEPDPADGPVLVAGHGFGAMVAATMASVRPDLVSALVLVDGGWDSVAADSGQTAAEFVQGLAEPPEVLRSMDAFLADRREFDPESWDADQERAARASVRQTYAGHLVPIVTAGTLRGCVEAMLGYQPLETLGSLDQPITFVVPQTHGADDPTALEREIELEDVRRLRADRGRRDRIVRYSDTGHNVMRYRPADLAAALLELLDRGE